MMRRLFMDVDLMDEVLNYAGTVQHNHRPHLSPSTFTRVTVSPLTPDRCYQHQCRSSVGRNSISSIRNPSRIIQSVAISTIPWMKMTVTFRPPLLILLLYRLLYSFSLLPLLGRSTIILQKPWSFRSLGQ